MTLTRFVLAIGTSLLLGVGNSASETADCRQQLKRQDEQCQALAEKMAEACPSGTEIRETAQCSQLSNQIANTCTRRPCGAPPRKAKRKGKKGGMKSKKASPAKQ
jgi:hypothetical protein